MSSKLTYYCDRCGKAEECEKHKGFEMRCLEINIRGYGPNRFFTADVCPACLEVLKVLLDRELSGLKHDDSEEE